MRGAVPRKRLGRVVASERLQGAVATSVVLLLAAATAWGQSAPDLSTRIALDGRSGDWTAVETAFRTAAVCSALVPPVACPVDEEPRGDTESALADLRQMRVTWDAHNLYIAVEATLGGQALLVFLDTAPGGLETTIDLPDW